MHCALVTAIYILPHLSHIFPFEKKISSLSEMNLVKVEQKKAEEEDSAVFCFLVVYVLTFKRWHGLEWTGWWTR